MFPTRFRIERINEKYDGIINTLNSDEFRQSPHCGCLSSHVTIAAAGDIKKCTMDTGEYTGCLLYTSNTRGRRGIMGTYLPFIYTEARGNIL